MDFSYFDLVVGSIVFLLGLKGIINGFFKELFGLLGIVGGVFAASRYQEEVGTLFSNLIFKFESHSALLFTGFLITLATFWIAMILLGMVFKQLTHFSGLGVLDKVFGFIFGSGKFFLITAIIVFSLSNIKSLHDKIEDMMSSSILYPVFLEIGEMIMDIDPTVLSQDINDTISGIKEDVTTKIDEKKDEIIKESINKITDGLEDQVVEDMKKKMSEQ